MKVNRLLYKVHRFISWLLVPLMIVVVVSGYAYVRKVKFLNRGSAFYLHDTLDLPLMLLIVAHVVLAARFELMRFKIKGRIVDGLLLVLGIVLGLTAIYVDTRFPR
ncbi:MAG: hypothetical protein AYK19_17530 [Theionarchaea archaeon DG-70-1]|nr:MAG: hypothetical protein AYK19_17530 [Theionarchaea archaeon DG-70-1]